MDIIYAIDIAGTFAFAISGALVAIRKKFDVFGVIIIAFVTAVGGGMTRDVLINAHPINWIGDINYIWTILIAVVVTFFFRSKIAPLRRTMFLFDTIGISVFTLIGVEKGINFNLHPFVALVMGMSSAVMGGVIRDVLTNEIPLIFHREIYASACLAGGIVYLLLYPLNINEDLLFVISAGIIILVRTIAVQYKLELPRIKKDIFNK
ncbi:trimeric intracellular cation channel family protein [Tenacibaculum sp. 1B UA]|uniref:trimeric intracellular cation channel family protein n=1 Tax=unclassified Tenacibaculum TaxID=2635139 RepID=UPI0026E2D231|nr:MULTISPECIES: trimeric intracellular cation channel family protein [unclassified Tenacibaculum]MDO6675577.1 trimeric intracellular cation channel family protein [Tenacibaculum sp. 1_MG-2023]MDX8553010.1 trimeric intracellular cation channel family protein [Tenacibaculum sp. 1B UA]